MTIELIENTRAGYRFLQGIEPYSSGVIALPGWEIVHATLETSLPWREGLFAVRDYLAALGLECRSLCGVELRCPSPHSIESFHEFNRGYRDLLEDWNLMVGSENPVARTNVAPVHNPPSETVLYGFSYTRPAETEQMTYVVAGGGETRPGPLSNENIVRCGDTGKEAMLEKAARVSEIMLKRLERLGADPTLLSVIDVYTSQPLHHILESCIMATIPAAQARGVHWFDSRPPVEKIDFEMDMRAVRHDIRVQLA